MASIHSCIWSCNDRHTQLPVQGSDRRKPPESNLTAQSQILKVKQGKASSLDIAPLTILDSGALQPHKRQLTGNDCSTAAQDSGCPEPALRLLDPQYAASMHTTPQSTTLGFHPVIHVHGSLLIYRPPRDGWLSWPCWLTDSGRLDHKVVTHPASSLVQDRESLPAETSVLTTMLRHQLDEWLSNGRSTVESRSNHRITA